MSAGASDVTAGVRVGVRAAASDVVSDFRIGVNDFLPAVSNAPPLVNVLASVEYPMHTPHSSFDTM